MTDDLVKRLRSPEGMDWRTADKTMKEAADALERYCHTELPGVRAALSQQAEPTRSQKLAEAGFTRRPTTLEIQLKGDADEQEAEPVMSCPFCDSTDIALSTLISCRACREQVVSEIYPAAPPADDELTENDARYILAVMLEGELDDFLQWYKPSEWLGIHRAAAAYLSTHFVRRDDEAVRLLREAQNALLDYVERLEKQGGMMNYGRKMLAAIDAYLANVNK